MSVHGQYTDSEDSDIPISITYGKSKDNRNDLKQYMISMITVSEGDLPVWISALSGNTSDKTHFREVIKKYAEQLAEGENDIYFVIDSAGYSEKNIREMPDIVKWLSRVPESIKMAKELIIETNVADMKKSNLEGYRLKSFSRDYGGIMQKWIVVFSKDSFERENHTLDKNIEKEKEKIKNELWHFGNTDFDCEKDALRELGRKNCKWKYHKLNGYNTIIKKKTGKRGRPKKNAKDVKSFYRIKGKYEEDVGAIKAARNRKGKFIVATNDEDLDADTILSEYKGQQSVERGFRFIKDPMFFLSATFLKKPERIESLVMIMGLSLLIYSIAQRKLRKVLDEMDETIPDQKGKPTKKPTMRRIFQMFEGIDLLEIYNEDMVTRKMLNLNVNHKKILNLMGEAYEKMYFIDRGCGK